MSRASFMGNDGSPRSDLLLGGNQHLAKYIKPQVGTMQKQNDVVQPPGMSGTMSYGVRLGRVIDANEFDRMTVAHLVHTLNGYPYNEETSHRTRMPCLPRTVNQEGSLPLPEDAIKRSIFEANMSGDNSHHPQAPARGRVAVTCDEIFGDDGCNDMSSTSQEGSRQWIQESRPAFCDGKVWFRKQGSINQNDEVSTTHFNVHACTGVARQPPEMTVVSPQAAENAWKGSIETSSQRPCKRGSSTLYDTGYSTTYSPPPPFQAAQSRSHASSPSSARDPDVASCGIREPSSADDHSFPNDGTQSRVPGAAGGSMSSASTGSARTTADTDSKLHVATSETMTCHSQSMLHIACCNPDLSIEEFASVLEKDPDAASKRAVVIKRMKVHPNRTGANIFHPSDFFHTTRREEVSEASTKSKTRIIREKYAYPIHLAIKHKLNSIMIAMLINAAPSVLLMQDGPMRETPLHLLLRSQGTGADMGVVNCILSRAPLCVQIQDRHCNTVLHAAVVHCSSGKHGVGDITAPSAFLKMIQRLCNLWPHNIHTKNFNGKTPLELAQHYTALCSHQISAYMFAFQQKTANLML